MGQRSKFWFKVFAVVAIMCGVTALTYYFKGKRVAEAEIAIEHATERIKPIEERKEAELAKLKEVRRSRNAVATRHYLLDLVRADD